MYFSNQQPQWLYKLLIRGWTSLGHLMSLLRPTKACRTVPKTYYFNPTKANINDTYISVVSLPCSSASHHVWHHFIHSSPSPAILGCICLVNPTMSTSKSWILDLYIDQGQGRGLDSRDRTLTRAGINILNNLLHSNWNCICSSFREAHY